MGKFYILIPFCVLSSISYSQSIPQVREIYDFAVGDTFEYDRNSASAGYIRSCEIIIGREDLPNATVYTKKRISRQIYASSPINVDTNTSSITQLDSFYYTSITKALDTAYSAIDSNFILYNAYYNDSIILPCEWNGINSLVLAEEYSDYHWAIRLGLTSSYYSTGTFPCNFSYSGWTRLIYAHKVNGFVYGARDTILFASNQRISYNNSISVSPNPVSKSFQIRLSNLTFQTASFKLFDALGRQVKRELISSETTNLNRENLNNGIYFWQVETEQRIMDRGKIIFQ